MKKISIIAAFVIFFIFSVFVFMPYSKVYQSFIDKLAYKGKVNLSYNITKASFVGFKLNNILIGVPNRTMRIDRCNINFNPLGLLLGFNFAHIKIYTKGQKSNFNIRKSKNEYFVYGTFNTSVLSDFLDNRLATFLSGFKGKNRLVLTLTYERGKIVINQLKITGDFELMAKGYIKSGVLRLMGIVKIGKIKETFSI